MAQVRVRKRGKTFSYIFEAGKVDGKRKVVEKGGYPTKAAAYKAGVEAYNDFIHGNIGITSEAVMLKDFMTNWLDNVVALNVKPTTLQTYRPNAQKQIFPRIGDIKVQDLTPAILDKWLRDLQAAGLSFRYIDGCHALLRQALELNPDFGWDFFVESLAFSAIIIRILFREFLSNIFCEGD